MLDAHASLSRPVLALIFATSPLLDLLVAWAVLRRMRGRRGMGAAANWGAGDLIAAVLAATVFLALRLFLLTNLGLGFFGALRMIYIGLSLALPAGALCLRWSTMRGLGPGLTRPASALAWLCLLCLPAGIHISYLAPAAWRLERSSLRLPAERQGAAPIKIGVLADIQVRRVGERERRAAARLMAEAPDLILIPGDLFQVGPGRAERYVDHDLAQAAPGLRALLGGLSAPGGVYFAPGNTDWPGGIRPLVESAGIHWLENRSIAIDVADRRVQILGLELALERAEARAALTRLAAAAGEADVRILLAHRPDGLLQLPPDSRIDLVVAGHTHGGQVALPFFGPPITLSAVPRVVAAGGLHRVSGNAIYVSRGLGMERGEAPPMRFNAPPEVSLIVLDSSGDGP